MIHPRLDYGTGTRNNNCLDLTSRANLKRDPTAAGRSSIRRHRSVRHLPRSHLRQNAFGGLQGFGSRDGPDRDRPRRAPFPLYLDDLSDSEVARREGPRSLGVLSGRRGRTPRESSMGESSLRFEMPPIPILLSSIDHMTPSTNTASDPPARGERVALTPRFAPAYPAFSRSPDARSPNVSRGNSHDVTSRFHPSSHRSSVDSDNLHRLSIDGLGDRERSFSPGDNGGGGDIWETFFGSVVPEERLPNESLLASSGPSAPAGLRGGSSGHLDRLRPVGLPPWLPSSLDSPRLPAPELIHCEFVYGDDEADDTEAESDLERDAPAGRRDIRRAAVRPSPRDTGDNRASNPDPTTGSSAATNPTPLQNGIIRTIINRLSRRDDIPDEWWASFGLSRTIPAQSEANAPQVSNDDILPEGL